MSYYSDWANDNCGPEDYDPPEPDPAEVAYWQNMSALYQKHAEPGERFSDFVDRVERERHAASDEARVLMTLEDWGL